MGLLEQVHGTLQSFGVDEQTIADILSMLELGEDEVKDGQPRTSAEGSFGSSPAGQTLSWDAGVAHAKVAEAMADMVAGLGGYAESLRVFRDDARRTDEDAAGSMTALQAATEQLTTPNIAAASGNQPAASTGQGS